MDLLPLGAIRIRQQDQELCRLEDEFRKEIAVEVERSIQLRLAGHDNALLEMWRGAHQAREANGHDSIRHCLISLRELISHLLHSRAPDKEVRGWTDDPTLYDKKGRPTRKARLRYLHRHVNMKPFETFVDLDVQATLTTIGLLQRVHEKKSTLSRAQVDALTRRVDGIILMLLDASET